MTGWAIQRNGRLVPGTLEDTRTEAWLALRSRGFNTSFGETTEQYVAHNRRLGFRAVRVEVRAVDKSLPKGWTKIWSSLDQPARTPRGRTKRR